MGVLYLFTSFSHTNINKIFAKRDRIVFSLFSTQRRDASLKEQKELNFVPVQKCVCVCVMYLCVCDAESKRR